MSKQYRFENKHMKQQEIIIVFMIKNIELPCSYYTFLLKIAIIYYT